MKVALIDYGSGNLRSVQKALEVCGAEACLVSSSDGLDDCQAIVVPGVGSFGDCARNLAETGLWEPIKNWVAEDRPYLGICLGYQLLFESSEECPEVSGLGVFDGMVRKFRPAGTAKIPHMGWNTLNVKDPESALYRGLAGPISVYFVHSYFPDPTDASLVSATCDYIQPFAASISRGNIHATQFHPEKSQRAGLSILANFLSSF